MRKGTIASIDVSKNNGIIVDENEQEISFSFKKDKSLNLSQKVNFEIQLTPDGLAAIQVEISK
ncbi:cold-shock protein [Pedobacter sp.]|uniref:cold-shock protein n=1 Tax=Pedobacter sp. TaxID=1411316 RepID=UPI003C4CC53A